MEDFKLSAEDFKLSSVSGKIKPSVELQEIDLVVKEIDPLNLLLGVWKGTGFNQIWRPANKGTNSPTPLPPGQDRFLELNQTIESMEFIEVSDDIPNRGFSQQTDIKLHGINYRQIISDANVIDPATGKLTGIHFEPGLWLRIPATTANPVNPVAIARLASIPHGATLDAQGTYSTINSAPPIPAINITPFTIGNPGNLIPFPESNLGTPTPFRTLPADIPGVTQAMVDNPNNFLSKGLVLAAGETLLSTTILTISTNTAKVNPPSTGGGTANISFLQGNNPAGTNPNALTFEVDATFWIETIKPAHGKNRMQLQYSQRVLLNFNGLSWPHVSVATLHKP